MIRELAQGIDGLVTIAVHAPGQALRTFQMLPADDRAALLKRIGMGDNYYYDNPQLYKMPAKFRRPSPPIAPTPGLGYADSSVTKALPYIAGGIVLVVVYNTFFRKGR